MSIWSRLVFLRFALLGVVVGLVVCEAGIRTIATPAPTWWDHVEINADGTDSIAFTLKWYHEGVATSHFSAGTARLTGNAFLPRAPVGVILGDSYVQALQVADAETMGAVVERLARATATPVNVRQFGWSLAAPATYIARAPAILARWDPAWVVVVLNAQDLVAKALSDVPVSRIGPDTTLQIMGPVEPPTTLRGWHLLAKNVSETAASRSALAWEGAHRLWLIRHADDPAPSGASRQLVTAPTGASADSTPSVELIAIATVRSLFQTFGDRLAIVYVGTVTATDAPIDREEIALSAACRAQHVACMSTRDAMIELRDREGVLTRGFSNTFPGPRQHLNASGHQLVGQTIWSLLAERAARAALPGSKSVGRP